MEWTVIVWNGIEWFRGPYNYETREEAVAAANTITLAPALVWPAMAPPPKMQADELALRRFIRRQQEKENIR